ncbi:erythromycin esterase-domain-containing protein [Hypoxylon cercidicola]|nr:erythromycin esterase-domain-containing protein [Hypoxylon cercidicola]
MFGLLAGLLRLRPGAPAATPSSGPTNCTSATLGALARATHVASSTSAGSAARTSWARLSVVAAAPTPAPWPPPTRVTSPCALWTWFPLSDRYERVMHDTGIPSFLVNLRRIKTGAMLQRFIGVIYRPATERWSHYIKTILAEQYDAFVWFDRTTAVNAFETAQPKDALSKGELTHSESKEWKMEHDQHPSLDV